MKKDKEWLKNEIKKDANNYPTYHDERDDLIKKMVSFHNAIALIDQLEEPEITEEQAWEVIRGNPEIKEFGEILADQMKYRALERKIKLLTNLDMDDFIGELTKNGLNKNKLVEVPQFIAETIEKYKENDNSLGELLSSVEHANIKYYHGLEKYRVDFNDSYPQIVDLCAIIARAWLDGYTIEKEPRWIVKRENGDYVDYFSGALYELNINVTSSLDATAPYKFTDKSKADAVALLIEGTVELIEGWKENE